MAAPISPTGARSAALGVALAVALPVPAVITNTRNRLHGEKGSRFADFN